MKSLAVATFVLGLFLSGAVSAEVFYLHENIPLDSSPNSKAIWFNDPVGGTDMVALGSDFVGNQFDVNKFAVRFDRKLAAFDGTIVVGDAGSGYFMLYGRSLKIAGLIVNNSVRVRPHVSLATVCIADLSMAAAGDMTFRTLTGGNNTINLSIANISGNGILRFGTSSYDNDVNGVWVLSITDTTPEFSGTIDLTCGALIFENSVSLATATLVINPVEDNKVVLRKDVSFGKVVFGVVRSLDAGTYTASELNKIFNTDHFSGRAKLTVTK